MRGHVNLGRVSLSDGGGFWSSEKLQQGGANLVIPYDEARVVNCSYELAMGPEVVLTGRADESKIHLSTNEQISIPPGQFALLLTEEHVAIPKDAIGFISIKFRYKIGGLVNVSGFHVDPGFEGRLLFSVYNAGTNAIKVTRGVPLFLLWVSSLDGMTTDGYKGKRTGQTSISDEDSMRLQGVVATPQSLASDLRAVKDDVRELRRRVGHWHSVRMLCYGALIALVLANLADLVRFVEGLLPRGATLP